MAHPQRCLKLHRFVLFHSTTLKAAIKSRYTGCNLGRGAGGSISDHLHTHVVPRWEEDTNFMPVISETKVIVEAIENTYDQLYEAFATQEGTHPTDEGAIGIKPGDK